MECASLFNDRKTPLSVISRKNSECKCLFSRWDLLYIDQELSYIFWIDSENESYKICVPRTLQTVILWQLHDSNSAGHMGERITLAKVQSSRYY